MRIGRIPPARSREARDSPCCESNPWLGEHSAAWPDASIVPGAAQIATTAHAVRERPARPCGGEANRGRAVPPRRSPSGPAPRAMNRRTADPAAGYDRRRTTGRCPQEAGSDRCEVTPNPNVAARTASAKTAMAGTAKAVTRDLPSERSRSADRKGHRDLPSPDRPDHRDHDPPERSIDLNDRPARRPRVEWQLPHPRHPRAPSVQTPPKPRREPPRPDH